MGKKDVETVCTPSPQNNEFKMITNYIVDIPGRDGVHTVSTNNYMVFAQVSFNATVRLKTRCPGFVSLSTVK